MVKKMIQAGMISVGLLLLRCSFGLSMLLAHGWPKLQAFDTENFPDPIGIGSTLSLILAIGAEFLCSLLIVLGLLTRIAAVPLVVTMLVAGLIVHADDPWQKKELAFAYLAVFLTLAITGPGLFSLDRWVPVKLKGKRKAKRPTNDSEK